MPRILPDRDGALAVTIVGPVRACVSRRVGAFGSGGAKSAPPESQQPIPERRLGFRDFLVPRSS